MFLEYYLFIKLVFLYSLIRTFVKFEPLQKHPWFMAAFYTAGLAFLSFVFLLSPQDVPDWRGWEVWLGKTFVLACLYFWILGRVVDGFLFWVMLLLGLGLVWF